MTLDTFLALWREPTTTMLVHTSGSTGQPQPMQVEKQRMVASARMTCDFLQLRPGHTALLCLPLQYIAGQMMVVRSQERHLHLLAAPDMAHPFATHYDADIDLCAMVPLQVHSALQVPQQCQRMQGVRHLIIGGGAIDPALEAELRHFPNAVWSSYGMTETLSHIALRRVSGPEASLWYTPMDGVRLSQDADGSLVVDAPALNPQTLHTHDIVEFNAQGQFRVIGRTDNVICSGGIKVQTEVLEQALAPLLGTTFHISWRPHPQLGQQVVMLTTQPVLNITAIRAALPDVHWMPRHYVQVPQLPLTGTGKPDRPAARTLAADATLPQPILLYLRDDLQSVAEAEVERLIPTLPPQRRDAMLRYRHLEGRRQGTLAYLLLCDALRRHHGITQMPAFEVGEHGKPHLAGHPHIHFNLSHCRQAVACALHSAPVGIDVERIQPLRPGVARYTMNPDEMQQITTHERPDVAFVQLWTQKEAVLKLLGTGITDHMQQCLVQARRQGIQWHTITSPDGGWVCSIAWHGIIENG